MSENQIIIKQIIVHILDNISGIPVISEQEQPSSNDIKDFIEKHINKVLRDDHLKSATFLSDNNKVKHICEMLVEDISKFNILTKDIALQLQELLVKNPSIPPADLVCCLITINNKDYMAILKFNYKPSYIHFVQQTDKGNITSIIKQKTTLPTENQKIEECVLINLHDFSIKLLEKKYEIDNKKQYYLSTQFLNCTSDLSGKEKIKILEKTTKNFIEKNFADDDLSKFVSFKKTVMENIEEDNEVDIDNVADAVFKYSPEIKNSFVEEVQKKGIKEKSIKINPEFKNKTYNKQKIVTDTGIEINLPIEDFNNKDKVEFKNNPDGTISIILKNIKGLNKSNNN